jgi:hypothetical protein
MMRRTLAFCALSALAFGLSVLLAAVPLAGNTNNCFRSDPQPGRGKTIFCDARCETCFQPVCNSSRRCDYTCQPIPGCTP